MGSRAAHWWEAMGLFRREVAFYSKVLKRMGRRYGEEQESYSM